MSLESLLAAEHRRLAPQYAARRVEQPRLATYPTLPSLVAKLTRTPKRLSKQELAALRRERAALLCVLLEAYQRGFDRLWEALVLTALLPMLSIVRKRFTGADAEEREGHFLLGVTPVLRTVDPRRKPEKIFGIIWMKTKKRFTPKLRREQEWCDVGFDVEADEVADEGIPGLEECVLVDIESQANGGATVRARVPVAVLALSRRRIDTYVAREFVCLPEADRRAIGERLRALKERCKDQEGMTVRQATRRLRRASMPPESATRLREGAPPDGPTTEEVAS